MPEENDVCEGHEDDLLDQRVLQRADGIVDEFRAVVERLYRDARREAGLDGRDLFLHTFDHRLRVLAGAHHDGAADGFPSIDIECTAPEVPADLDGCDVLEEHRRALHLLHGDEFEILRAGDQPDAAQDEFRAVFLHDLPSDIEVRVLHGGHHIHGGDSGLAHLRGVQLDLVLLHEPADRGDLGDAFDSRKLVADVPILDGAEFRKVVAAVGGFPGIDIEVILIDPAEPRGIGAELRGDALGHLVLEEIQALEDAGAGEVVVHAFLENDRAQREAEHRGGADFLHAGDTLETGGEGIGHLILDFLRAAPRPIGDDEHLVFR